MIIINMASSKAELYQKESFYSYLRLYYAEQSNNKPFTTAQQDEIIKELQQAKNVKDRKNKREYYLLSTYGILTSGDVHYLIKKNKNLDEPKSKIVIAYEDLYDRIHECHIRTGHGGSVKMKCDLQSKYCIPRPTIQAYLKVCQECSEKKVSQNFAKQQIEYNKLGQVDLLDYHLIPDGNFNWILVYHDYYTKFVNLRPLQSNTSAEVAEELKKIFVTFGAPRKLQSVHGKEFTNQIILKLKQIWPERIIESDRSSVKISNQDIDIILRAWMRDNCFKKWTIGLHFIQWHRNTTFEKSIGCSPYRALFGHNLKDILLEISEMAYFTRMTTTTKDPAKQNVVLMGRNTWDCIPLKFRPLKKRINMVLTRNNNFKAEEKDVLISNSLDSAMDALTKPELIDKYESVWVIGGSHVYNEVLNSRYFYRLYLTEVMEKFECDTFMPPLPENVTLVRDPEVPEGINEENGIKFVYKVYENTNFNSNE